MWWWGKLKANWSWERDSYYYLVGKCHRELRPLQLMRNIKYFLDTLCLDSDEVVFGGLVVFQKGRGTSVSLCWGEKKMRKIYNYIFFLIRKKVFSKRTLKLNSLMKVVLRFDAFRLEFIDFVELRMMVVAAGCCGGWCGNRMWITISI